MPSIRTTTRGGVIRWDKDDWYAGLLPFAQNNTNTAGMVNAYSVIDGKGFALSQSIDPYRYPGLLSPGFSATTLTNSSTVDTYISGQASYGYDAYLIGSTGAKIYHLNAGTGVFDASAYHTITHGAHATILGDDIINYKAKVGGTPTLCRFYSFNDGTDGDVGRDANGVFDDDFMSTVPVTPAVLSKDYTHPLCVGNDDVLYIGNGNVVAGYDGFNGTNGTFTAVKLTLPAEYTINSFQKLPNFLVIFASKQSSGGTAASECTVFFWDMVSADPAYKYNVDCYWITASFAYGTTVGCFGVGGSGGTTGNAGFVKLFMYDGTKFDLIKNMPASVSSSVLRNGVVVLDETIYFGSTTGTFSSSQQGAIFSYGKDFLGKWSLNCFAITGSAAAPFLDSFYDKRFYANGPTNVEPIMLQDGYYATSRFITPHVSPPLPDESRARLVKLKVQFGKVTSGGRGLSLILNTNKGTNQITITNGLSTITEGMLLTNYLKDSSSKALGKYFFETIALEGLYSAGSGATAIPPLIEFVEVYYSTIKI